MSENKEITYLYISPGKALFAVSLSVVEITIMQLLLGSVFRNANAKKIWTISFSLLLAELFFLSLGKFFYPAVIGLILIGAGLAAGFPIMLSYVGNRFKELSGTAFSIAFVKALLGNMIINYSIGFIVQKYSIGQLTTVGFVEFFIMALLCIFILKKITDDKN